MRKGGRVSSSDDLGEEEKIRRRMSSRAYALKGFLPLLLPSKILAAFRLLFNIPNCCVIVLLCYCIVVLLYHCVIISLCYCVVVLLYFCDSFNKQKLVPCFANSAHYYFYVV